MKAIVAVFILFAVEFPAAAETADSDSSEAPPPAASRPAQKGDYNIQIQNCAAKTAACISLGAVKIGGDEHNLHEVNGVSFFVPSSISKGQSISGAWYNGILPDGKSAGFAAPCDLSKAKANVGMHDRDCRWIDGAEPPCTPAMLIKDLESKGFKQSKKTEIFPVELKAESKGGMVSKWLYGSEKQSYTISYPADSRLGKFCYYQFKTGK